MYIFKRSSISLVFILTLIGLFTMVSCVKESENQVSSCRILSPANGQEIAIGDIVIISVDADGLSENIEEVRFFIDGIGKSSVTTFPFNYEWNTSSESIGDHQIKAISISTGGVQNSDEITVILTDGVVINEKPIADFSSNIISGISPLSVIFTDQTSNYPNLWQWNFGDGGSSGQQNPTHIFNADGVYTVTLIASNEYGSDTLIKSNYIVVGGGGGGAGEPCPGIPTISDSEGNIYNTVQIGNQCWMKENLRLGSVISGIENMTDNSIVEKYCYDDNPANCVIYGGLYQWAEIMNYTNIEGTQGICPVGWHIPSDQDWKLMEMSLGMSQEDVNEPDWRGEHEGNEMKTTSGWVEGGNGNNTSGFSGLPGGYRGAETAGYGGATESAFWWTSTSFSDVQIWYRQVGQYGGMVNRTYNYSGSGISVRCVKD